MPDKRKYADRAEYLIQAVAKRRQRLKEQIVRYKGGTCVLCGYTRTYAALDLHHIDSRKKSFGLSVKGMSRSLTTLMREADKCVLLCANCHREIHAGIVQLPQEIAVATRGELREAYLTKVTR